MTRFLKITALIMGILIVLIIIAGLIIPMIIDVNDHKDRISLEIKKATGYEVAMEGDIELSLVPWIGLSLGKTHVASPPEFGDIPLASLDELQVRIKFWPLFWGRVEADRIILNRFELDLVIDENGRQNWIIPEEPSAEPELKPDEPLTERKVPAAEPSRTISDFNIEGLQVVNAAVSYEDRQTSQSMSIRDFNLETGRISMDAPFDISADMKIQSSNPDIQSDLKFSALAAFDSQNDIVRLDNFLLNISAHGEILATPIQNDSIRGDLLYELSNNAIHLNNLDIDLYEAQIKGKISASSLDETPDISFEINGTNIDLDKIMAESSGQPAKADSVRDAEGTSIQEQPSTIDPVNLSFLTDFKLDGKLDFQKIKADNIIMDSFSATIKSGNGKMSISPLKAELYGGTQESDITLEDLRGILHISALQNLDNLQIGPFIQDLAQKDMLTGTARIHSDIKTWGQDNEAFVRNMSGKAELALTDGVIKGVDLEKMIRDVFAVAAGQIGAAADHGGQTSFTSMGASFNITNGIAVSRDLAMNSPVLGLTGEMTADLPNSHLDSRSQIRLDGALREELASRYNLREVTIPLRVRGPFDDLSFTLDSETIIKSVIQEKGDEALRRIIDQIAPSKDRDQDNDKPSTEVEGLLRRIIPGR
jgi:AsmA protein